jgi:hypothetical protein
VVLWLWIRLLPKKQRKTRSAEFFSLAERPARLVPSLILAEEESDVMFFKALAAAFVAFYRKCKHQQQRETQTSEAVAFQEQTESGQARTTHTQTGILPLRGSASCVQQVDDSLIQQVA